MTNQNPFDKGNASRASRPLNAGSAQQIAWANSQIQAAKAQKEKQRLDSEHSAPKTPETTESAVEPTPTEQQPEIATDDDEATENRRAQMAVRPTVERLSHSYPPDPVIRYCAECKQSAGWLVPDPFRPDRVVHQDCAGGMRLVRTVLDAPYASGSPYRIRMGAMEASPETERPPDLPRPLTDDRSI